MTQPGNTKPEGRAVAQTCDGCGSWTNVPVKRDAVLSDMSGWGWVEDEEGELFCPECQ